MSFGPYVYSNNGLTFRAVASNYTPVTGEVLFATTPDSAELASAFPPGYISGAPGYTAAAAGQAAIAAGEAALLAGFTITSTGTPALNGTYDVSDDSMTTVNKVVTAILLNGTFLNGATTQVWVDLGGTPHVFPDTTTFKNFATALANYVALVEEYIDSEGTAGSLPTSSGTIP
jgi:hypothetical protein